MSLKDLTKKMADLRAEMAKVGKEEFIGEFAKLFEAHPILLGVKWRAYTPYFNDGDACTFSVHEPSYSIEGLVSKYPEEDEEENGAGYIDSYSINEKALTKEQKAAMKAVKELFKNDDDLFLAAFGDHVRCTATRTGIDVEECDHD